MSYERAALVSCDADCGSHVYGFNLHSARMKARARGWWNLMHTDLCPEHRPEQTEAECERCFYRVCARCGDEIEAMEDTNEEG